MEELFAAEPVLKKKEKKFAEVPIEEVEEFWNARPCNIRHSSLEVGTVEYFLEVERKKYFVENHIPEFAEFKNWSGKVKINSN